MSTARYLTEGLPGTGGEVRAWKRDGERFRVVLGGLDDVEGAYARAQAVLASLLRRGVPWPCGDADAAEVELARAFLRGERALEDAPRERAARALGAWQRARFDRLLQLRIREIDAVLEGDLLVDASGELHECRDPRRERRAVAAGARHVTGVLFGPGAPLAGGAQGSSERTVLEVDGVVPERLSRAGDLGLCGGRRPLRVLLGGYALRSVPGERALELAFTLGDENAARALMREVAKLD